MTKVKISLTIDQAVLDRVDEAAWRSRRSRSAFVEDVLDNSVQSDPVLPEVEERRAEAAAVALASVQVTPDWRGGKP